MSDRTQRAVRSGTVGFLLSVLTLVSLATAQPGRREPPARIYGGYTLVISGTMAGSGTAAVTPQDVIINARLLDGSGQPVQVRAKLRLVAGRFEGSGTVGADSAQFSGRLDIDDGQALLVPRLVCTVRTANGQYLRMVGQRSTD